MTDNTNGLNKNAINENFPTNTGGTPTVYADRNYVQGEITNRLSSQDLNITFGSGLCVLTDTTFTGTAQTVISVGIGSSIGDLNNVNINALANDQILLYNGTSWVNSDGASIAKIEDLPFVYNPVASTPGNAFLRTNPGGTSTIFWNGKFVEEVNIAEGCKKTGTTTIPVIGTDLTTIPNTINDDNDNFFIITSKQGTANYSQRKLEKKNIKLTNFDNDGLLRTDGLSINPINGTCPTALEWATTGTSTGTLTLDLSGYFENVNGLLPINQGGTSASTAEGARAKLGLSIGQVPSTYPLSVPSSQPFPSFTGACVVGFGTCQREGLYKKLVGSDIRIVSAGISAITVTPGSSGAGYTDNSGTLEISYPDSASGPGTVSLGVSFDITIGGSITSISPSGNVDGFPYLFVNESNLPVVSNNGVETASASVTLELFDSYINFGSSVRENGVGFRFKPGGDAPGDTYGILKVNNGTCSTISESWETINRPPIQNLDGVCITNPSDSQFLIYGGTCWRNKNITGPVTINENGVTTLSGISAPTIGTCTWATGPVSQGDFSTLKDIYSYLTDDTSLGGVSRIKEALAKKYTIDSTHTSISGSLVYISSPGSCILTPIHPPRDNSVLSSQGSSAVPQYTNVANTFFNKSIDGVSPNSLFCLADMTSGTSQAALYSKTNFNNYIAGTDSGASGGLGVSGNGDLIVTTKNTETITSVNGSTNTLLIGTDPSVGGIEPVKNIRINDFVNSAAISSTLQVGVSPGNLSNYPSFSKGEAAFFTDDQTSSGTCYIAVYNGTSWYGVSLITSLWP